MQAACRALQLAKEKNIKKLVLYTDSKFTINGESEHRFHLHGSLRSILNQCDCCRCDPLGEDLEAEQLEAEVWRSRHQQRRLWEAGPAKCRDERGLGECLPSPGHTQDRRSSPSLPFRCIFLAMPVTMATSRLTGCHGKELQSRKCMKKTAEEENEKQRSFSFGVKLKVEESLPSAPFLYIFCCSE